MSRRFTKRLSGTCFSSSSACWRSGRRWKRQVRHLIATGVTGAVGHWGPVATLSVTYLVATVLTEPISNNAVAVLLTPIAFEIAATMGVDARPFAVAVMFGSSASFATPIGYQTNTYVFGAGGYRFPQGRRAAQSHSLDRRECVDSDLLAFCSEAVRPFVNIETRGRQVPAPRADCGGYRLSGQPLLSRCRDRRIDIIDLYQPGARRIARSD